MMRRRPAMLVVWQGTSSGAAMAHAQARGCVAPLHAGQVAPDTGNDICANQPHQENARDHFRTLWVAAGAGRSGASCAVSIAGPTALIHFAQSLVQLT